jgi:hypothetical protein
MHFFVDFWKDKEARVIFVRELHCALCIVRELRGALSKSVHCLPPSCSGAITEKVKARGMALIDVFPLSVGGEGWDGVTVLWWKLQRACRTAAQLRGNNRSKCGVAHFFGTYVSSQITAAEPGRQSSRICHLSGYNRRRNFSKHKSPGTQQLWNDLGNTKTHLEATLIESSDPGSYPGFLVTQTNVLSL